MGGSEGAGRQKMRRVVGTLLVLNLLLLQNSVHGQEAEPTISVTVNQSKVVRLGTRSKTVSVAQPEIADVVVLDPNQLLINGKSVGKTSLVVWNERGGLTNFDLIVLPDFGGLQRQLRSLFPEEQIEISSSGAAVVLRGEVSNEVVYDKVLEIVRTYLPPRQAEEAAPAGGQSVNITNTRSQVRVPPTGTAFAGGGSLAFTEEGTLNEVDRWADKRRLAGIIDLLVIRESRQIQLNVIVAEISLSKLRELGVDFAVVGEHTSFLSLAGTQGGLSGGSLFSDPSGFPPTTVFGGGTSAVLSYVTNNLAITSVFRMLQNKDISEILAQPQLVMKNGRSGGFLAGGEFPIPFASDEDVTIDFKPFGVRLDFVPTITWSDTIDLRILPEVSEIDTSVSVSFSGVTVPGLRVRRSVNRVEMREGEALIISGLLDKRTLRELHKFPFLGDLPILGALFRTTRFRNQETELVFVVTPHIVRALRPGVQPPLPSARKYDDPDFRQLPVPTEPTTPMPQSVPHTAVPPAMPLRESTLENRSPVSRSAVPESRPSLQQTMPTTTQQLHPDVRQVPPPSASDAVAEEPTPAAEPTMP
jgi:pilus assembly protein CpaC